ncbi:beta-N-acetylhexosaminidase [Pedobacter sp. SL55]|uniref:beta-N-acetylhexosaminidase n=1 Tax=Pedobacter sp. SL55 TaxID=2995161 RepID=UPI00226EB03B|nr:family 20 glycosylhydrolase [Pedobacter sp. SL55]WAC41775.1 family 20 glycosylhydrolase [Pedobacter sp. SL55]
MKFLLSVLFCFVGTVFIAKSQELPLIPQPEKITYGTSFFKINDQTSISLPRDKADWELVKLFAEQFSEILKKKLITTVKEPSKNTIIFKIKTDLADEAYLLDIRKDKIEIRAAKPAGWFYGWQTLTQILRLNLQSGKGPNIQELRIADEPKFAWRGLMLDVSRHFFSKDVLKRYIAQMAKYKLNVLHLHLTDNQGWRVEIKQLPKLTSVGAWRVPRTGYWSNMPAPEPGEAATYGGFYSHEDIKELVNYAKQRFVDIVPEIDLPGHSLAFVASYPEVSCTKTPQQVLAGDPWNAKRTNVVCVGNDSTYTMIDQIITEIAAIFPSKYIHIGGDEVTRNYWSNCNVCQQRIATEGLKNVDELQSYFVNRVAKMVKAKGKTPIGWYETLEKGLDTSIVQMSWKDEKGAVKSSNAGQKVILTPAFLTYLDFYQGDPYLENAPFTVNRLSNSYKFNPLPEGINAQNVLGGQGSLWTEQVPNERKLQFMTWPRGFTLAENLWSKASKPNWADFVKKIEAQLPLLILDGVNYSNYFYDPIPIAKKDTAGNVVLTIDTEVPGLAVYYAFDDTDPDQFYPKYKNESIHIPKGAKTIRAVSYRGDTQKSRILKLPVAELKRRAKL